jgi:hypothetical protein
MEPDESTLPPFLRDCPTDPESLPLQVSLLTMEVAAQRLTLARLAKSLTAMAAALVTLAAAIEPAPLPDLLIGEASDGGEGNRNDHH